MKPTVTAAVLLAVGATALMPAAPTACADSHQSFQSPSANIDCGIGSSNGTTFAACEIRDYTWTPPLRPTPCMRGFGDRISIQQGSAVKMSRHSDMLKGDGYPALAYGQLQSLNSVSCRSEFSSMTCIDSSTGHYFLLARDSYELH
ncbi:MAG: hypothetical protein WBZ37_17270 [Mycobacterium sp.]